MFDHHRNTKHNKINALWGSITSSTSCSSAAEPVRARPERRRFFAEGRDGLADRKRTGRPRTFSPLVVAEIKELACELPATTGVPLSRWSCAELARELVGRAVVAAISAATV
jgi:hypothetical protein